WKGPPLRPPPAPHPLDARHRLHALVGDRRPAGSGGGAAAGGRGSDRLSGGRHRSRVSFRERGRARPCGPSVPTVARAPARGRGTKMNETLDLIVVGAGPTGIAIGAEARRQGLSVLLVDRGPLTAPIQSYPTLTA